MKRNAENKRYLFIFSLILISYILNNGTGVCFGQQKYVATVNGQNLLEYDLQLSLNEIMPAGVFHGGFSSEKRAAQRPKALQRMIDKELLYQETLKRGMKADDKAINKHRDKLISKFGSLEKYIQVLKKNGLTDDRYVRTLKKIEMATEIIKIEVDQKASVSDAEALDYYSRNVKKYMRPSSIKLRHILISVKPNLSMEEKAGLKNKAEKLLSRIRTGEDMGQLARDYSDDRYRIKGGDYGFIHKGRLDPDLEKHVMKLDINQVSDVIQTRFGFHIARVEAARPASQLSFEDVSEKIKKQIFETRKKKLEQGLISRLRKNAEIIIH